MKHQFTIVVDANSNLDTKDIQDWLENILKTTKIFFQSGEVYSIKIEQSVKPIRGELPSTYPSNEEKIKPSPGSFKLRRFNQDGWGF